MNKFYEWCEKCIVETFFRNILQSYCSISATDAEIIPDSLAGRIWVNSDMRQMIRLMSLAVIQ